MAKKQRKSKKSPDTLTLKVEWILLVVTVFLLIASIITSGFRNLPLNFSLPFIGSNEEEKKEEVKTKLVEYIDEAYVQGQQDIEVVSMEKDPDEELYIANVKVGQQETEVYVSLDGTYLYLQREKISVGYPKQETPDLLLFTMSYCPYGNQAEDFVKPVYELLGDHINFEPHYIVSGSDGQYSSLHGEQELNQGVRELCVYKDQEDKFWDFVMAANEQCDSTNVDTCWEQVAQETGVNVDQVKSCENNEKNDLLANEVSISDEYDATSSPTLIINGKEYSGERDAEELKKAVCSSFENEPEVCSQEIAGASTTAPSGSCN